MKRIIGTLIIGLSILLGGCMAGEGYQDYMNAVDKTENMNRGVSRTDVIVESTFNEAVVASLGSDVVKGLSDVRVTVESRFDNGANQAIYDIFYIGDALGMDLKVYKPGNDALFLKVPFANGIYALDEQMQSGLQGSVDLDTFMKSVGSKWNAMLLSENIFVGEKTVIKNDDGEIKTTKFTVKPTSAQLETFTEALKEVIISNKSTLVEALASYQMGSDGEGMSEEAFELLVRAIFSSMKITRYEEVAFMDVDGYLVDERIEIGIEYTSGDDFENLFETQTIQIHTTYTQIEKAQDLNYDILDQVEIMPIDELMEWSVTK